jgi:hypothetical protein
MVMGSIFIMILCAILIICTVGLFAWGKVADGDFRDAFGLILFFVPFLFLTYAAGMTFASFLK